MAMHELMPLSSTLIPAKLSPLMKDIDNVILIKDGHIITQKLTNAFTGVTIQPFNEADDVVISKVHQAIDTKKEMALYNKEALNSSLLIQVPKNKTIKETLHIFIAQEAHDVVHNTIMYLEQGAELDVFEHLSNETTTSLNVLTEAYCEDNSRLNVVSVSTIDSTSAQTVHRHAYLNAYARATYTNANFADALTDQSNHIELKGAYSEGVAKTIAFTNKAQEALFKTLVEHLAKETKGYIEHYGVANDQSFLVFEGIGKIHKNMKRSIARQSNKGVVLGEKARLDANPLLLIDEFDVEASHGAAIGRIDEEQLYYLMSRGLSRKDAERLIINGYLAPLKDVVHEETLMTYIEALLKTKTA